MVLGTASRAPHVSPDSSNVCYAHSTVSCKPVKDLLGRRGSLDQARPQDAAHSDHLARALYAYWKYAILDGNAATEKELFEPALDRLFWMVYRSEEIARVFLQDHLDVGNFMHNATSGAFEDRGSAWIQHYRVAEAYSDALPAMLNNCLQRWAKPHEDESNRGRSDVFCRSPLHLCAAFGFKGLGEVYLQMGHDPNILAYPGGQTALHFASDGGHIGMVEKLLGRDADIEKTTFHTGRTALHMAATRGHENVVQRLLKGGADANTTDKLGHTALELAAQNGREEIVELLINHIGYNSLGPTRRQKAITWNRAGPTSLFYDNCRETKEWHWKCSDCGNGLNCYKCGGIHIPHCSGRPISNEVDKGWAVVDHDQKM